MDLYAISCVPLWEQVRRAMSRKKAIAAAVDSEEARDACAVVTCVHEAMMTLDKLSVPALEAVRDNFARVAEERGGPRGELKRAWMKYVQQKLDDAPHKETPLSLYERA